MTDTSKADWLGNIFRMIAGFLDRPAYWLLGIIYQIFFNVASADLFNNATILGFYKRIQLIIGVFMIFQLAVTILRGIVNPDEVFGAKSGIGSIITRVITALILLTVLVPVSIPGATTEYERQVNNNGLLFGTLYSLQHRILSNNTLGRLVLGTTDGSSEGSEFSGDGSQSESLKRSSRIFTATILKGFIRINLVPEEYRVTPDDGRSEEMLNENRICKDIDDDILEAYTRIDADPGEIISLLTESCSVDTSEDWYVKKYGKKKYVFAHMPIISAVVAFIFVFVLLSYTIEIAIRAVKLAVLRLIAPIPIISYMDPKGSKDGAFNSWVKALTSTYIDLFVRLAIIYFVIYLVQDMIVNGIVMNTGSGMVGILSAIAIWIGLFMFARQAPKFIRQVLGMKEDAGKGVFSGLGMLGGVAGVGAAAVGMVGSARANYVASKEENAELHPGEGRRNVARNVGSAIVGAIAGGATGVRAAVTAKDHSLRNAMEAMQKRNAVRASHSTAVGRLTSSGYGLLTGQTLSSRGNDILKGAQDWMKAQGDWKSALEEEAKVNGRAIRLGTYNGMAINGRYEELERAVASAHDGKVTLNGTDYDANIFTKSFMDDALKAQVGDYQADSHNIKAGGKSYETLISEGQKLYKKRQDVIRAARDVNVSGIDPSIARNFKDNYKVDDVLTYGAAVGAVNVVISNQQNNMRQRMRIANDQNKK